MAHAPFPYLAETYLHLSFGHLDTYSAAYYTYLRSLVIAKHLFTAFDPDALLDRRPRRATATPCSPRVDRPGRNLRWERRV